ncbi:hypothetical protein COL5a_008909 [Colletotrichum fioriniae]|uniref:uncharacterized protein n=1 Tax=Colletotrichum fioriniae TaxID=710243 RepID=UPI00230089CA|nr:uncharacterized protein COL516b_001595 [Colletotrichum fioriniae]KAJ0310896.1 hypothetical protein COL516b_001595 [Colletotrichum fioriniae]KAJ0322299.1 hypothetical protein COL5a_008909 [Colletotrichum fioriniae]KAJ3940843.1 hypothetical protein N0V96_008715 [Colletotrichum fioriniae]
MADPSPSPVVAAVNKRPQMKTSVPYEVFLHVVEQLIGTAKDPYDVKVWSLAYNHSLATKLVLNDVNILEAKPQTTTHKRHQKLCLVSQINQQSRRMTEKTFTRLPLMVASPDGLTRLLCPVKAYVPLTDEFVPFFTSLQEGREAEQFIYDQAVLLPSSSGYALLSRVEKIFLLRLRYLITANEESLSTLVRLPNLKSITFNVGRFTSKLRSSMKPGLHEVDPKKFPRLAQFCTQDSEALRILWADHLEARGVKLFGVIDNDQLPIIELHPSRDKIMITYILPYADEAVEELTERMKHVMDLMII